ncbi:MAG: hypothetical protein EOO75_18025 [Myxococcales bacterium]|nr:MAG: hypothetical protein EOO75_18025 [Myxococcales bacterium]
MSVRQVSVWRGAVTLVSGDEPELPREVSLLHYTPTRWLERTLDATVTGEARLASVRHRWQNSGSHYVAFLAAALRPGPGSELRVRVGVGDPQVLEQIRDHEAGVVLDGLVEELACWSERPAGEIVVDHAVMHPVDTRDDAWCRAARLAAALLRPGCERLDDAELEALGDLYLRR